MVRARIASKQKKKPADFKRPKRKVGRKVQAANVTSVGISSRRINLIEQSVLIDRSIDDITTYGHLSLQDLLTQLGHYNAHVRQRALQGLRELIQRHGAEGIIHNVSVVLEKFLPTISDIEIIVREAALATWKELISVLNTGNILNPFSQLIIVYLCSGLTHLQVGIRHDTLKAIGIIVEADAQWLLRAADIEQIGRLIENFQELITSVQTQGVQVANTYQILNSTNHKSSKSTKKLKRKLNESVLDASKNSALGLQFAALEVLRGVLSCVTNYTISTLVLQPQSVTSLQQNECIMNNTNNILLYPTPPLQNNSHKNGNTSNTTEEHKKLNVWQTRTYKLINPLLDLWTECIGAVDGVDNSNIICLPENYVLHMKFIAECIDMILQCDKSSNMLSKAEYMNHNSNGEPKPYENSKCVHRVEQVMLNSFPMIPDESYLQVIDENTGNLLQQEGENRAVWFGLNVALTKLASTLINILQWSKPLQNSKQSSVESGLIRRMSRFVTQVFEVYVNSTSLLRQPSTVEIIQELLATLKQLLELSRYDERDNIFDLLKTFTKFYNATSTRSQLFRHCTSLVHEFVLDLPQLANKLLVHDAGGYFRKITLQWLVNLGKVLEISQVAQMLTVSRNLTAMIRIMNSENQFVGESAEISSSDHEEYIKQVYDTVIDKCIAFIRYTSSENQIKEYLRWHLLSPRDQMTFVSMLYHLPYYPIPLLRELAKTCNQRDEVSGKSIIEYHTTTYVIDVLHQRQQQTQDLHKSNYFDFAHLVSFLMSCVFSRSGQPTSILFTPGVVLRKLQLSEHIATKFESMKLGSNLCKILAPTLIQQFTKIVETKPKIDANGFNGIHSAEFMTQLHLLVLFYTVCLKALKLGGGTNSDQSNIPSDVECHIVEIARIVLLTTHSHATRADRWESIRKRIDARDHEVNVVELQYSLLWTDLIWLMVYCPDNLIYKILKLSLGSPSDDLLRNQTSISLMQALLGAKKFQPWMLHHKDYVGGIIKSYTTHLLENMTRTTTETNRHIASKLQGDWELLVS